MSKMISKEVICPHCGKETSTALWTRVNTSLEPRLRNRILDESLFAWSCSHCGLETQLLYPFLYYDRARGFMVYLVPGISESTLIDTGLSPEFPELPCLQKRLVPGLNKLKEKILIFEAELDDRATELTKLALAEIVAKRQEKTVCSGYFCSYEKQIGRIDFSFFLEEETKPCYCGTLVEAYERSLEIVRNFDQDNVPKDGFLKIDAFWADKLLQRYRAQR